jgi:hypothetical protein
MDANVSRNTIKQKPDSYNYNFLDKMGKNVA